MELMITKKIGKKSYHFTVQGSDLHEVMMEAERLSFDDVARCALCNSDNLELSARVAQNKYKYVGVKCRACRGEITMGKSQKDDKTYFLRRNDAKELDWQPYTNQDNG
jgi:late competence protein required for DNA uptake (superfamily II DNA/RNA helicase)